MVEISAIASTLTSLKTLKDMAQSLIGLREKAALQGKLIDIQSTILDAQSAAFVANEERSALVQRVRVLEEEVANSEAWDAEKQRYQLQAIDRGAFAYVLKPEMQGTEPPHWLCTNCYENGHRSFLQFQRQMRTSSGGRDTHSIWACGSCGYEVTVHYTRKPTTP